MWSRHQPRRPWERAPRVCCYFAFFCLSEQELLRLGNRKDNYWELIFQIKKKIKWLLKEHEEKNLWVPLLGQTLWLYFSGIIYSSLNSIRQGSLLHVSEGRHLRSKNRRKSLRHHPDGFLIALVTARIFFFYYTWSFFKIGCRCFTRSC